MNTLKSLQEYAKRQWTVDKTRLTTCTYKDGAVKVTEKRLWIWLLGNNNPVLVKEAWLTGNDREDFASNFKRFMEIAERS